MRRRKAASNNDIHALMFSQFYSVMTQRVSEKLCLNLHVLLPNRLLSGAMCQMHRE